MKSNYPSPKFAKKDLLALYDITHPTLRIWFRRAGLEEFVGRRKFLIHELVLIFQTLGRPRLARTAAQRVKDVYARINGLLPDEVRFREKYKQEIPPQRQDRLPNSEEELDAQQVYTDKDLEAKPFLYLWDAVARLTATAIFLIGQKARKRAEKEAKKRRKLKSNVISLRKKLRKRRRAIRA